MSWRPADRLGEWVRSVRLHEVTRTTGNGGGGGGAWLKRRRRGTDALIGAGNVVMKLGNGGIRMFASVARWRAWELASYRLLHGAEGYRCGVAGRRGIWMSDLPGRSLREHALGRTLTVPMLRAAGAELRRAHGLWCGATRRAWSHGDPHLGNLLYDPASARARLIDFETQHEPGRPADWRHADDLLTFLLELIGRAPAETLPKFLRSFLDGYARPAVIAALRRRLGSMTWPESLLWLARSPGANAAAMKGSLRAAREALERRWRDGRD